MTDVFKKCPACKRKKKIHLFSKNKARGASGESWCKACNNKARKLKRATWKDTDFVAWKAATYRGNWLHRARDLGVPKEDVPNQQEIREWLKAQQPYTCFYTGKLLEDFELDHKLPISAGGSFSLDNIVLCAPLMNKAKGNMTMEEFRSLLFFLETWEDKGAKVLRRLQFSGHVFEKNRWKR